MISSKPGMQKKKFSISQLEMPSQKSAFSDEDGDEESDESGEESEDAGSPPEEDMEVVAPENMASLEAASDDELLAEMKKRGLSADIASADEEMFSEEAPESGESDESEDAEYA